MSGEFYVFGLPLIILFSLCVVVYVCLFLDDKKEYSLIVCYGDERLKIRVKATSKRNAIKLAKITFKGCKIV